MGAILVETPLMNEEDLIKVITNKRNEIRKALDNKRTPKAEPGYLCAYCNHKDICPEGRSQIDEQ